MRDETVIFMHIPKNGGSTAQSYVRKLCRPEEQYHIEPDNVLENLREFAALPDSKKAEYRLIRGHFKFGIHTILPRESVYVSVLRDPVERTVSQYYHAKRNPSHPHNRAITQRGVGLADYVSAESRFINDNVQTRFVAGVGFMFENDVGYGGVSGHGAVELGWRALEKAISNIEERFAVVGVTERMTGFMCALGEKFEVQMQERRSAINTNPDKHGDYRSGLDDRVVEIIERRNRVDRALYDFVVDRTRRGEVGE